jgi:hypothetical protein
MKDEGLSSQWHKNSLEGKPSHQIIVPYAFQTPASGVPDRALVIDSAEAEE